MTPIKVLIPEISEWGGVDYTVIVDDLGNTLVCVSDDDYQGDTRWLIEKDGRFGVLLFGFGSCSGCDWAQGVKNHDEAEELQNAMADSVRWGTREETLEYLGGKDWEVEPTAYGHAKETLDFVNQCRAALTMQ